MAPLTILTDDNVKDMLQDLSKEEVESMQKALRKALHEYSTAHQDQPECELNQPERMTMEHNNGTSTLFMPSTGSSGIAMKVVTLAAPNSASADDQEAITHPDQLPKAGKTPQGGLMLMGTDGKPFGFLNAEEMTAFRTALASSLLMVRRKKVKTITVFGTGKQSYWHVRLALLFHGSTILHVNIIIHRFSEQARDFFKGFVGVDEDIKRKEGWVRAKFGMISPSYNEYERLAKDQIRNADIIICGTPSLKPLFHHSILTNTNGRVKPRLIIAVGSFKPTMIELPPEILMQAVKHHGDGIHVRKRALEGGCIIADVAKAMKQTGEFIEAKLEPNHVVEIGEIVMLEEMFAHEQDDDESAIDDSESYISGDSLNLSDGKSSLASALSESSRDRSGSRRSSRSSSFSGLTRRSSIIFRKRKHALGDHPPEKEQSKDEREMNNWLVNGNVIYKSVGLGLMDLVVGVELVKLAKKKHIGITVPNF